MAEISDALQARLSSGVTTLAWVWVLTRRDGGRFGFTDHDQALTIEDVVCEPQSGFEAGDLRVEAGASPAQGVVFGRLNSCAITEADLNAGVWDGAQVTVYRADWTQPDLRYQAFTGELGAMRSGPEGFEAELSGLSARLNRTLGRFFSRRCDAQLGDSRCGVELASRRQAFSVHGLVNARTLHLDGSGTDITHFEHGTISWPERTVSDPMRILTARPVASGVVIELDQDLRILPGPQETVMLEEGCDKRFETCQARFANTINFRGCPHMPGNDALLRVAREGSKRSVERG